MTKNILITGSSSFTGKTLLTLLNKNNYKVFDLVCDITRKNEVNDFIKDLKPTFVIHLAAISSSVFPDPNIDVPLIVFILVPDTSVA